jgi:hypothetical protein
MSVTISDKAMAVAAIQDEIDQIDSQQLAIAKTMGEMILVQVALSRRASALSETLGKLFGESK